MHTAVTRPRAWPHWKESNHVALLAGFEDSITGTRVKEFCRGLSRDLGASSISSGAIWLFNTFRFGELREIAARNSPRQIWSLFLRTRAGACLTK